MWLRIAAHRDVAYLRDVDQASPRVSSGEHVACATYSVALDDLRERKAAFDALFDDYGAVCLRPRGLREQADRALARQALWSACRAYDRRRLDTEPIDELEAFARQVYPDALSLRECRGLQRAVGSGLAGARGCSTYGPACTSIPCSVNSGGADCEPAGCSAHDSCRGRARTLPYASTTG